jgi:pectate lyase
MIRYNTSFAQFEGYSGSSWSQVGGGATGGGGDTVFVENSVVVTTSYTLSAGKNAESVGPITINSGATVTIPSDQRWVVL